jgi:hypothetical protein
MAKDDGKGFFYVNICCFYVAFLMLSDIEEPSSEENYCIRKPDSTSYLWPVDLLACLSPFSNYSRKLFGRYRGFPSRENNSIRNSDPDFLLVIYRHFFPICNHYLFAFTPAFDYFHVLQALFHAVAESSGMTISAARGELDCK